MTAPCPADRLARWVKMLPPLPFVDGGRPGTFGLCGPFSVETHSAASRSWPRLGADRSGGGCRWPASLTTPARKVTVIKDSAGFVAQRIRGMIANLGCEMAQIGDRGACGN